MCMSPKLLIESRVILCVCEAKSTLFGDLVAVCLQVKVRPCARVISTFILFDPRPSEVLYIGDHYVQFTFPRGYFSFLFIFGVAFPLLLDSKDFFLLRFQKNLFTRRPGTVNLGSESMPSEKGRRSESESANGSCEREKG